LPLKTSESFPQLRIERLSKRAAQHSRTGTFVAGILAIRRGTAAPAICPGCTLVVWPIFLQPAVANADTLNASPQELADAVIDCVEAGDRILNLSLALVTPSPNREPKLEAGAPMRLHTARERVQR
jgi:hypothetical protein